jgi:hypothetical protein
MATVVVFSENGVRILEGANPSEWVNNKQALINPKFPRHIPPHLWKLVDGKIEGTAVPTVVKKDYTIYKYIATALLGALAGYLLHIR